jgi:Peptidase family M23
MADHKQTQGEKMTFRPYSMVAVLLFPALIFAQTSSTAAKPQASKPSAAPVYGGAYPPMSTQAKQRAQKIFGFFDAGQTGALWATFTEGTKKNYGSEEKFAAQIKKLRENLGTESKMVNEIVTPTMRSGGTLYSRLSDFSKAPGEVVIVIGLNEHGQTDTFLIGPERVPYQGRLGGYKDVTQLKLPFSGEWLVEQGGRSAFLNGYFLNDDQRFSIDFVLVKNGRLFSGDGSDNSQYFCFGQPVLAPADGQAVMVEDGFQDNPPGRPTRDSPRGNMVLLSHGNGEFSVMDHLKQNSVRVKKGDKVKQGDAVGECGNSGPSSVPHLHFAFQNSGGLPLPDSLPAQFVDYYADGKPVASGEPERGQTVSNTPPGAAQPPSTK